ncbi:MAG: CCA tRNA nucleotidyltransferase [Alphaproteobacteria bacterium]|nr:CCA tRNA nucleotidyltransferase [Alphaproteobacteria bacterium]
MTRPSGVVRLQPQSWMTAPATRAVLDAIAAGGAEVRFVGGCVRDACIGRPVKDIDIATPEPPALVMERLKAAGIHAVPTGIAHGTVTAVSEHRPFEITTLRRDVETDGRRAVVAFTDDWRQDAARRDFTFNAMSCAPDGQLYDYFGGRADLEAGRVRFVGDAETRIREDVLRLLRFFRFHAHYGKPPPDADGLAACKRLAGLLPGLSGERLAQETLRLLDAAEPASVLSLMDEAGILKAYLAEAERIDALRALVTIEGITVGGDAIRRLAALIAGGRGAALAVAERLRLSVAQRDRLAALAAPPTGLSPDLSAQARRIAFNRIDDALRRDVVLMAWAAETAAKRGQLARREAEDWRALFDEASAWQRRELPVKGRDVLALGVPAGPRVGELIDTLTAWWEAGDFTASREACLAELRRRIEANGPGR